MRITFDMRSLLVSFGIRSLIKIVLKQDMQTIGGPIWKRKKCISDKDISRHGLVEISEYDIFYMIIKLICALRVKFSFNSRDNN